MTKEKRKKRKGFFLNEKTRLEKRSKINAKVVFCLVKVPNYSAKSAVFAQGNQIEYKRLEKRTKIGLN